MTGACGFGVGVGVGVGACSATSFGARERVDWLSVWGAAEIGRGGGEAEVAGVLSCTRRFFAGGSFSQEGDAGDEDLEKTSVEGARLLYVRSGRL